MRSSDIVWMRLFNEELEREHPAGVVQGTKHSPRRRPAHRETGGKEERPFQPQPMFLSGRLAPSLLNIEQRVGASIQGRARGLDQKMIARVERQTRRRPRRRGWSASCSPRCVPVRGHERKIDAGRGV